MTEEKITAENRTPRTPPAPEPSATQVPENDPNNSGKRQTPGGVSGYGKDAAGGDIDEIVADPEGAMEHIKTPDA